MRNRFYLSFLFATTAAILEGCSGKSDPAKEQARHDSICIADSIAAEKVTEDAALQYRLDSIRQDSISRIDNIIAHFGPRLFLDIPRDGGYILFKDNVPSTLKKDGFTLVSKKYVKDLICVACGDPDEEELIPGYKIMYENHDIGVTVEWTYNVSDKESKINDFNGVTIDFKNPELERQFLDKVRSCGFKKEKTEWGTIYTYMWDGMHISYSDGKYVIRYVS